MRSVGIWTPFRITIANYFMTKQICKDEHFAKKCIKLDENYVKNSKFT